MKTYKVCGAKYNEEPRYCTWDTDKKFPKYTVIDEREWIIDADSLRDAENWFVANYPDYFMGGSIQCITPNVCEFCMYAIPCYEYGTGNYETVAARIAFVQNRLSAV